MDKRPDEEDMSIDQPGQENEGATFDAYDMGYIKNNTIELSTKTNVEPFLNASVPDIIPERTPVSPNELKRFVDLLLSLTCGFERIDSQSKDLDLRAQTKSEKQKMLDSFNSLNQNRFEKWILNLNLGLILVISASLFIFFSIPPSQHVFSDVIVKMNSTTNIN